MKRRSYLKTSLVLGAGITLRLFQFTACALASEGVINSNPDSTIKHQPIVEELISILEVKPGLKETLEESIRKAERFDAPTLTAYYEFLDEMVTMIPTDRNLLPMCLEFYYLIDNSPDNKLQKDPMFQQ